MVENRPLIVSIFFALAIYIASTLSGINGGFLAVILGGAIVGYMIEGTIKDGAIHGAIIGLVIALISIVLLLIQISGLLALVGAQIIQSIAILAIFEVVFGVIGGILGALINSESLVPEEAVPEETEK